MQLLHIKITGCYQSLEIKIKFKKLCHLKNNTLLAPEGHIKRIKSTVAGLPKSN